jgi:hypothetical protein
LSRVIYLIKKIKFKGQEKIKNKNEGVAQAPFWANEGGLPPPFLPMGLSTTLIFANEVVSHPRPCG